MRRRDVLRGFAGLAGGFLAGCTPDAPKGRAVTDSLAALPADGRAPDVLRVGVTPTNGKSTAALFEPLVRYLADERGIRATIVSSPSYDDVVRALQAGELDTAFLSPLSYARTRSESPIVPAATAARSGSPTYLGYLVVRADDPAQSLSDLAHHRVAYVERSSTSGYLYPRALVRARGFDPDAFFGEAMFLGDHAAVIAGVAHGKADVGATASAFVDPERFERVAEAAELRVVAKTARIPLDCAVIHKSIARAVGERFRQALLGLVGSPVATDALSRSWGVSGFVEVHEKAYDEVARILAEDGAK